MSCVTGSEPTVLYPSLYFRFLARSCPCGFLGTRRPVPRFQETCPTFPARAQLQLAGGQGRWFRIARVETACYHTRALAGHNAATQLHQLSICLHPFDPARRLVRFARVLKHAFVTQSRRPSVLVASSSVYNPTQQEHLTAAHCPHTSKLSWRSGGCAAWGVWIA